MSKTAREGLGWIVVAAIALLVSLVALRDVAVMVAVIVGLFGLVKLAIGLIRD